MSVQHGWCLKGLNFHIVHGLSLCMHHHMHRWSKWQKLCPRAALCSICVVADLCVLFFIYILSNNQIIYEYLAGLCTLLVVYCFKITNLSSERIHNSMHRHIKLYYLCTLICDMCQRIYLRFHEQNFRNLCKCECMQVKQNACDWEGRRTKLFK